jgi:hypothetical protein
MRKRNTRRVRFESLESRFLMAMDLGDPAFGTDAGDDPAPIVSPRHNPLRATDVDINGHTSPLDALLVLNEVGMGMSEESPMRMADTNNDGRVSPVDALVVINSISMGRDDFGIFPGLDNGDDQPIGDGGQADGGGGTGDGGQIDGGDGQIDGGDGQIDGGDGQIDGGDGQIDGGDGQIDGGDGQIDGGDGQIDGGDGQIDGGDGQIDGGDGKGDGGRGDGGTGGGGLIDGTGSVVAVDDYVNVWLPTSATRLSEVVIDPLANDKGEGLRIVSVAEPQFGTVVVESDPNNGGRDRLRYTPAEVNSKFIFFRYVVQGSDGSMAESTVFVNYEQDSSGFSGFGVQVPDEVVALPGEVTRLVGENRNPLIQVRYAGTQPAKVGVLLSWAPPSDYFNGIPTGGQISTSATGVEAIFYPQFNGVAWLYGTVEEVNRVLANLTIEPAAEYPSAGPRRMNVFAFLYGVVTISDRTVLTGVNINVPATNKV